MRVRAAFLQPAGDEVLVGNGGAGVHRLFGVDGELADLGIDVDPADPQTRGDEFRERANAEDEGIVRAQVAQRRQGFAFEAEHSVRVVLDDDRAMAVSELEQAFATRQRHRHSGRVLEGRDGVDDLRGASGAPGVIDEGVDLHAFLVDGDLEDLRLIAHGRGRTVRVGRRLTGDEVTGGDEEFEPEVEPLHAAGGDEQAVPVALLFGRDLIGRSEVLVEGVDEDGLALRLPVREVLRGEDLRGDAGEVRGRQHVRGRCPHAELDDVVVVLGQHRGGGVDDGSDELVAATCVGQSGGL